MHTIIDSFHEYQNSRNVNPFNVTDSFCVLIGALEADLKNRMDQAKDIPTKIAYEAKLESLGKSFAVFQQHSMVKSKEILGSVIKNS